MGEAADNNKNKAIDNYITEVKKAGLEVDEKAARENLQKESVETINEGTKAAEAYGKAVAAVNTERAKLAGPVILMSNFNVDYGIKLGKLGKLDKDGVTPQQISKAAVRFEQQAEQEKHRVADEKKNPPKQAAKDQKPAPAAKKDEEKKDEELPDWVKMIGQIPIIGPIIQMLVTFGMNMGKGIGDLFNGKQPEPGKPAGQQAQLTPQQQQSQGLEGAFIKALQEGKGEEAAKQVGEHTKLLEADIAQREAKLAADQEALKADKEALKQVKGQANRLAGNNIIAADNRIIAAEKKFIAAERTLLETETKAMDALAGMSKEDTAQLLKQKLVVSGRQTGATIGQALEKGDETAKLLAFQQIIKGEAKVTEGVNTELQKEALKNFEAVLATEGKFVSKGDADKQYSDFRKDIKNLNQQELVTLIEGQKKDLNARLEEKIGIHDHAAAPGAVLATGKGKDQNGKDIEFKIVHDKDMNPIMTDGNDKAIAAGTKIVVDTLEIDGKKPTLTTPIRLEVREAGHVAAPTLTANGGKPQAQGV